MPFKFRLLTLLQLWLLAGAVYAIFADLSIEAGESELLARLQIGALAPIVCAVGIAFTLFHRIDSSAVSADWTQQQQIQNAIGVMLVVMSALHAISLLGLKTKRQFTVLSVAQILYLSLSVPCVLHYFHYEATHGHG